jgi:4a-hydroxytetrahydrobiopterin dehydratase
MMPGMPLSRIAASAAIEPIGWRYLLGTLCASVPVGSIARAALAAAAAASARAELADAHLRLDLHPDPDRAALAAC